jgi:hypothetical protein
LKKYFLPTIHSYPSILIKIRLQATGSQVAFASCAEDNTGCPILRLDFGDLAAPPENYQLELTCSAGPSAGLSTIPVSTCTVTHVSGQIYDVNCCSVSPCCPCSGDPIVPETANSDDLEIDACCPCGPVQVPTSLNGCSETTIVRVLDGSGDTLSSVIGPDDCPALQQN